MVFRVEKTKLWNWGEGSIQVEMATRFHQLKLGVHVESVMNAMLRISQCSL